MQGITIDHVFQLLALLWLVYFGWLIFNRMKPKKSAVPTKVKPAVPRQTAEQLGNVRFLCDGVAYEVADNKRHVLDIHILCTDKIDSRSSFNETLKSIGLRLRSMKFGRKKELDDFFEKKQNLLSLEKDVQKSVQQYRDKLLTYEKLYDDFLSFYDKSLQKLQDKKKVDDELSDEKRLCILGCMRKSERLLGAIKSIEESSANLNLI